MATQYSTPCDFPAVSNDDLADFILAHAAEFGGLDLGPKETLAKDLSESTIIRHELGFAVVAPGPFLQFLYVTPDGRGRGLGRKLLRAAERVTPDYYLHLKCHKSLRRWYGAKGYRVLRADGDTRTMIGPFKNAQDWAEYRGR